MRYDTNMRDRARELRRTMTLPEVFLWRELRGRRLPDTKFRRQHPFGPYILDFYCEAARFCVEVDGGIHGDADQRGRDLRRDAFLRRRGVHTLRIPAWRVLEAPRTVADRLRLWSAHLASRPPGPTASACPPGGGTSPQHAPTDVPPPGGQAGFAGQGGRGIDNPRAALTPA